MADETALENIPAEYSQAAEKEGSTDEPAPVYSSSIEWCELWFIEVYARYLHTTGARWCPEWWNHVEAAVRIDAAWRSWEVFRREPQGMAAWLRDVGDVQWRALSDPDSGPFLRCKPALGREPASHEVPPPLPIVEAPDQLRNN